MNSWAYNLVEHLEKFIDFGLPLLMLLAAPILIHVGVRSFKKPPGPACPKCKYDMRSIQTLSCPECGHTVKTAEELSRPKRRWVLLTLGVLMLLFSLSAGVLMVSTMLEAKRAEQTIALVRTVDKFSSTDVIRNTQPPPDWAMWIASFIAGEERSFNWINPNGLALVSTSGGVPTLRLLLAVRLLDYCCQPTWTYYKYWPVEVFTELSLNNTPFQSELEIIGLCKDLEKLDFYTSSLPVLKAEDYAVFEPMSRLRFVGIVNGCALPKGALKSIFKNKPNLEHVEISIHSHADEALIEIGAGSPHVKIMKLSDDDGLDTDYPDDMTPSPPSGITSAGLAALSSCTQMEELEAWLTDLKPDDLNFLAFMKNLRVLKVHISNTHQITAANFDAIGRSTSLRDLTFSFRSPAGQKPQGLLRGLSGLTNLEKLSLRLYGCDENDFEFLKSMTSLHNLHLSSYGGDGSGLRIIENHPSLKTLTLERPWKLKPEHEAFLKNLKNVNVTIKR